MERGEYSHLSGTSMSLRIAGPATVLSNNRNIPRSLVSGQKHSLKIKFLERLFLGHQGPRSRDIPDHRAVSRPKTLCKAPYSHARKRSTKINFLGLETARWGGGLPREGVVANVECGECCPIINLQIPLLYLEPH